MNVYERIKSFTNRKFSLFELTLVILVLILSFRIREKNSIIEDVREDVKILQAQEFEVQYKIAVLDSMIRMLEHQDSITAIVYENLFVANDFIQTASPIEILEYFDNQSVSVGGGDTLIRDIQ